MSKSIRVRTKQSGNVTDVKMLIRHPMETGLREDKKTGKPVPAHFIKEVTCKYKNETVFQALWGIAISKNPFLSFTLKDVKKGDELSIGWVDNKGQSDTTIVTI